MKRLVLGQPIPHFIILVFLCLCVVLNDLIADQIPIDDNVPRIGIFIVGGTLRS